MKYIDSIGRLVDPVAQFVANNPKPAAVLTAWLAAWVLYGVLGKRYLGADDDFWERIRAVVIPLLERLAAARGYPTHTRTMDREFAGVADLSEEAFERKLRDAGFLRQPLASLHRNSRGWQEDGSWSKTHGLLMPAAAFVAVIPVGGPIVRRFLSSLDTVLALRQLHVVYYTEKRTGGEVVHVYAHDEPNPINPLTAYRHLRGDGFRAAPKQAQKALAGVGVDLRT